MENFLPYGEKLSSNTAWGTFERKSIKKLKTMDASKTTINQARSELKCFQLLRWRKGEFSSSETESWLPEIESAAPSKQAYSCFSLSNILQIQTAEWLEATGKWQRKLAAELSEK